MILNLITLPRFFLFLALAGIPVILHSKIMHPADTIDPKKSGWNRNAHIISFGIGFQNYDAEGLNKLNTAENYSISSISSSIPLYAKFEFFYAKHLGIGANMNYNTVSYYFSQYNTQKTPETFPVNSSIFTLNIRINYHIFYGKAVDVYLGGGSGIRIVRASSNSNSVPDVYPSGFLREYELSAGIRYLAWGKLWACMQKPALGGL